MNKKAVSPGGKHQVLTKQVTRSNWVAYWADKDGHPVSDYAEALTEDGAKRLLKCKESGLTIEALSKFIDDHYDLNERGELRYGALAMDIMEYTRSLLAMNEASQYQALTSMAERNNALQTQQQMQRKTIKDMQEEIMWFKLHFPKPLMGEYSKWIEEREKRDD